MLSNYYSKNIFEVESDGAETIDDKRQITRKEYNHPPDTVMAIIYAIAGTRYSSEWHWA
jgi:hypothetical protein